MTLMNLIQTMKKENSADNLFLVETVKDNAFAFGIDIPDNIANNISMSVYNRLKYALDYDLIYIDIDQAINILISIVNSELPYILSKIIKYQYRLSPDFMKGDTKALANTQTIDSENNLGYAGYSLENQQGDFNKTNGKQTITQTDYLNFLSVLGDDLENWNTRIVNNIISEICVTIMT